MSRLERKLDAGDFVVTAEMPTIDGGGFPEIQRQLAPMKAWVDAVNATDNPAAHAHASPQLIAVAEGLRRGRYLSGRVLTPAPRLLIGAVENPGAPPFGHRVSRAAKKADAGARFLQLQICFMPERLEAFMAQAAATGLAARCAMIPSILIVRSALALKFVNDKVAGIKGPPELIARAEAASDQQHECFEIACELADHARSLPGVAGLHFISFRKDAGIAKLCTRLGIPPRAERDTQHGHSSALAV